MQTGLLTQTYCTYNSRWFRWFSDYWYS